MNEWSYFSGMILYRVIEGLLRSMYYVKLVYNHVLLFSKTFREKQTMNPANCSFGKNGTQAGSQEN